MWFKTCRNYVGHIRQSLKKRRKKKIKKGFFWHFVHQIKNLISCTILIIVKQWLGRYHFTFSAYTYFLIFLDCKLLGSELICSEFVPSPEKNMSLISSITFEYFCNKKSKIVRVTITATLPRNQA